VFKSLGHVLVGRPRMSLFDDVDPDSEEGRNAMMEALMDADPDQVAVLSAPVLCLPAAVAVGHSYHMGPPDKKGHVVR
jgi:hypothetical protein